MGSMSRVVKHLLTLDCTQNVNRPSITEGAELVYQPRGRPQKRARFGSVRSFSKSPQQKIMTTQQVVPKQADQEIEDMVTLILDEAALRHQQACDCGNCNASMHRHIKANDSIACSCSGCGMTTN